MSSEFNDYLNDLEVNEFSIDNFIKSFSENERFKRFLKVNKNKVIVSSRFNEILNFINSKMIEVKSIREFNFILERYNSFLDLLSAEIKISEFDLFNEKYNELLKNSSFDNSYRVFDLITKTECSKYSLKLRANVDTKKFLYNEFYKLFIKEIENKENFDSIKMYNHFIDLFNNSKFDGDRMKFDEVLLNIFYKSTKTLNYKNAIRIIFELNKNKKNVNKETIWLVYNYFIDNYKYLLNCNSGLGYSEPVEKNNKNLKSYKIKYNDKLDKWDEDNDCFIVNGNEINKNEKFYSNFLNVINKISNEATKKIKKQENDDNFSKFISGVLAFSFAKKFNNKEVLNLIDSKYMYNSVYRNMNKEVNKRERGFHDFDNKKVDILINKISSQDYSQIFCGEINFNNNNIIKVFKVVKNIDSSNCNEYNEFLFKFSEKLSEVNDEYIKLITYIDTNIENLSINDIKNFLNSNSFCFPKELKSKMKTEIFSFSNEEDILSNIFSLSLKEIKAYQKNKRFSPFFRAKMKKAEDWYAFKVCIINFIKNLEYSKIEKIVKDANYDYKNVFPTISKNKDLFEMFEDESYRNYFRNVALGIYKDVLKLNRSSFETLYQASQNSGIRAIRDNAAMIISGGKERKIL